MFYIRVAANISRFIKQDVYKVKNFHFNAPTKRKDLSKHNVEENININNKPWLHTF